MRANYCNNCGQKLRQVKPQQGADGRAKLYADIAHPINARCREMIQKRVVEELRKEQELARQPGYRSRYDESYDAGPEVREDEMVDRNGPIEQRTENPEGGVKTQRSDGPHGEKDQSPNKSPSPTQKQDSAGDSGQQGASSGNPDISPASGDDFGKGIFD